MTKHQAANGLQIMVTGPAGTGIKFMGKTLQKLLTKRFYTFGINGYYSLIKGGRNYHVVRIAKKPTNAVHSKIDILYAQNQDTLEGYLYRLKAGGIVLVDTALIDSLPQELKNQLHKKYTVISVPAKQSATENKLSPLVINTLFIGVICSLLGINKAACVKDLKASLKRKPQPLIEQNIAALKLGFTLQSTHTSKEAKIQTLVDQIRAVVKRLTPTKAPEVTITDSAYAAAMGFINAQGKVFAAYPMTPSTPILHYLAKLAGKYDITVHQASTEIEAAGIVLGANWAGVRAATATSGGGLDLMAEFISMAGMAEVPSVFINAQRVGPSTGLPTWQEQSDLNQAKNIGHGEFLRIVLAAYDPVSTYKLIAQALNLADIYQTPVILLLDKLLTTSLYNIPPGVYAEKLSIERGKLDTTPKLDPNGFYPRYAFSPDGISPRPLIGKKGAIHVTNSDEHDIYGFSLESDPQRVLQHSKRLLKEQTFLKKHWQPPLTYNPHASKTAIVSWGSTYHVVRDAIKILSKAYGKHFAHIHFVYMHPQDLNRLKRIFFRFARIILVENNATAQLEELMNTLGLPVYKKLLKFDGEPFFTDEIINALKRIKCI